MTAVATLLGGPLDGELRRLEALEVRVPRKCDHLRVYADPMSRLPDLLPPEPYRYVAMQDIDGRWWYVFQPERVAA